MGRVQVERKRRRAGDGSSNPKEGEAEEIGANYVTILNILQSIRKEAKKESPGAGNARYGRREVWTPCTHLPFSQLPPKFLRFLSYFLFCASVLEKSRKM